MGHLPKINALSASTKVKMSRFKAAIPSNFALPAAPWLVSALSHSAVKVLAAPAKPRAFETAKRPPRNQAPYRQNDQMTR